MKNYSQRNKFSNLKAKKSLGQNFLKSEIALRKIIEAGEIHPVRGREGSQRPSASNGVKYQDLVLEIGPGRGTLTEQLLASGCQLIAVEKDSNLYELLKEKFQKEILSGQLKLINRDILSCELPATSYKIIANIPYNITGAILKKFLTAKNQPTLMVLMVQHEVAMRILARDGKESILSISVKAYGEPKMIAKVDKRYFSPAPKVNSAIIKINYINRKNFTENRIGEEKFWEIVKTGFAHKRKKLSSNLKNIASLKQKPFLLNLGNQRAEDLTLSDWIMLAKS